MIMLIKFKNIPRFLYFFGFALIIALSGTATGTVTAFQSMSNQTNITEPDIFKNDSFPPVITNTTDSNNTKFISIFNEATAAAMKNISSINEDVLETVLSPMLFSDLIRLNLVFRLAEQYGVDLGYDRGVFSNGYEWGRSQAVDADRLVASNQNPHIEGARSLKVTVFPTDIVQGQTNPLPGARAEVLRTGDPQVTWFSDGDEVWYNWYTMFPTDLVIPHSWHTWTQWHAFNESSSCPTTDVPEGSVPCFVNPLGFNLQNYPTPEPNGAVGETLELRVIDKDDLIERDKILWHDRLQKGIWYQFILHVNWKACGSFDPEGRCMDNRGGFVEMWLRRWTADRFPIDPFPIHVLPKTEHYTLDETEHPNAPSFDRKSIMKQGLYHCNVETHSRCPSQYPVQVIYHDGMEYLRCSDIPNLLVRFMCSNPLLP
jgi:hypothetical protein